MTAKEELSQYKYARDKVEETLEEYEKYKTRAEKVTSIISDMPRGGQSSDKVADNAIIMADLNRQYEERWLQAEREKLKVEQNIDSIEEPYQTLLRKRYVEGLSFEEVAEKMNYTYSAITKMHGKALYLYLCAKK